jgi:hypothetical protein
LKKHENLIIFQNQEYGEFSEYIKFKREGKKLSKSKIDKIMGLIVMQCTIDYFVKSNQLPSLNTLMGDSNDWEMVKLEKGSIYYKYK